MRFCKTLVLTTSQKAEIHELWNMEYPEKLRHPTIKDFENYLNELKDRSHILMLDDNERIRGWYFDFVRENEKWFAIILSSNEQGKGFGTQLLNMAKEKETELCGWVVESDNEKKMNGEIYISPLKFYLKNGFRVLSDKPFSIKNTAVIKINWQK